MNVIQAHQSIPYLSTVDPKGMIDHITEVVTRAFYDEVDRHLKETPGGIILGQPRMTVKHEPDWVFGMGDTTTIGVSASCEDLPLPPEYRFIGGPADGAIIRTRGERMWLVPVMPPISSMSVYSYAACPVPMKHLVARYERQGDTGVYFYQRTYEA